MIFAVCLVSGATISQSRRYRNGESWKSLKPIQHRKRWSRCPVDCVFLILYALWARQCAAMEDDWRPAFCTTETCHNKWLEIFFAENMFPPVWQKQRRERPTPRQVGVIWCITGCRMEQWEEKIPVCQIGPNDKRRQER